MLTQEALKELLSYNPDTGEFAYLQAASGRYAGLISGCKSAKYIHIMIGGKLFYLHRLAFLYMEGVMPAVAVDHIDRDRRNNKWSNLRQATTKENNMNRGMDSRNKSGYNGVGWHKQRGKWRARVGHNGNDISLGLFSCVHKAGAAAKAARDALGFSESHGGCK